jgi:hypothetical protein
MMVRTGSSSDLYAGAILTASGVMYLRLIVLLLLFNRALAASVAPAFGALAFVGCVVGGAQTRRDGAAVGLVPLAWG